jgi:plasmid stability protein
MSNLTLSIDDQLIKRARIKAIEEGTSLSAKVRELLTQYVQGTRPASQPVVQALPVYMGQGGMNPGIDPTSNKSMLNVADDTAITRTGWPE